MRVLIFQYFEQLDELALGGLLSLGIVGASGDQDLRKAAGELEQTLQQLLADLVGDLKGFISNNVTDFLDQFFFGSQVISGLPFREVEQGDFVGVGGDFRVEGLCEDH